MNNAKRNNGKVESCLSTVSLTGGVCFITRIGLWKRRMVRPWKNFRKMVRQDCTVQSDKICIAMNRNILMITGAKEEIIKR